MQPTVSSGARPPPPSASEGAGHRRWRASAAAPAGIVLILLVFLVDYATGHEIRLFLLYFLPVALVSWNLGARYGLGAAGASAAAWTAADILAGHEYSVPAYLAWNAMIQLVTFSLAAVVVSRIASGLVVQRTLNRRLAESLERLEQLNAGITRDLDLAALVQRSMIPPATPRIAGLDVAVTYRPAIQVGGDLLSIEPIDEDCTVFFLGDAMGHGVRAALIMAAADAVTRRTVRSRPEPAALLAELNATILAAFPDQLVSAVGCLLDTRTRRATLAVAGHPRPVWIRHPGPRVEELGLTQLVLGVQADVRYESVTVELEPADGLVFYTDGVIEAAAARGDPYGTERLHACVARAAEETAKTITDRILADVVSFVGNVPIEDDVALLVVKMASAPS